MKLRFDPDLDYQKRAIDSVTDLFRGQQSVSGVAESALGIGNRLTLSDTEVLANLQDIQHRNGLAASRSLASGDFTVEMETGTGKTYVYLRTIFELNRLYGFTKFIVVVPSVAIKEGVSKTLQITEEHFKGLYAGQPFDSFLYESAKLGQVRTFATSPTLQIMVMTVGAINKKDANTLYKDSEKAGGEKPIDLIRSTGPILIVDEPQSVDGGLTGAGKAALDAMNPLCTLRYSATHTDKHHGVFRLDAIEAYKRKLVKQIEVASLDVDDGHNTAYVRFLSAGGGKGAVTARIEIDAQNGNTVRRKEVVVQGGDDLQTLTNRAVYAGCRIGEIRAAQDSQRLHVHMADGEHWLDCGQAVGSVDGDALKRLMIRRTIHEHLEKERRLAPLGIKVLSLFFIDAVAHYRSYDEAGHPIKGKYARIFEEEYRRAAQGEQGAPAPEVEAVHGGYFSIDRARRWTEPEINKDGSLRNQSSRDDAERAYSLIMKDKEKLLGFETKLKFIFSHSALKEGWDNPNVFQICALREVGTERERRQTIGRGLRLCVNQNGERQQGFEINTLTVIATESYEAFAEALQEEIEQDIADGPLKGNREIKNADERIAVKARQALLDSVDFQTLWNCIKHKTTYRVRFDTEKLIVDCARAVAQGPPIAKPRVRVRKASLSIGQDGITAKAQDQNDATVIAIENDTILLPDVLTLLQDRTQLTRKSLARILTTCGRLHDFKQNPQAFIEMAGEAIERVKDAALIAGITYQKIGDDSVYPDTLFQQQASTGYARTLLKDATKSVFEHVVCEPGSAARAFAEDLEKNAAVKMYVKLPAWFEVPTPLGSYNPGWAVLMDVGDGKRLTFIVDTQDSPGGPHWAAQRACGAAHFEALATGQNPARAITATTVDELLAAR